MLAVLHKFIKNTYIPSGYVLDTNLKVIYSNDVFINKIPE